MIRKKMLTIGLGLALTVSTTAVMANGLTLKSRGISNNIKVNCNGISLPYGLKPNSTISNLPWLVVFAAFHSKTLHCNFMLDDNKQDKIGSAELDLSLWAGKAQAKNLQYDPTYHVTVTPATNAYFKSLAIKIEKS